MSADMTPVDMAVTEAQIAAAKATREFLAKHGDRDACGFASVKIYKVKGSTRLGRALIRAGFRKSYDGSLEMWNPSGSHTQSITAKEVGAEAAAAVLKQRLGLDAVYAWSRMD